MNTPQRIGITIMLTAILLIGIGILAHLVPTLKEAGRTLAYIFMGGAAIFIMFGK